MYSQHYQSALWPGIKFSAAASWGHQLLVLLFLLILAVSTIGENHVIVEGEHLALVVHSPYQLRQPHSLPDFLQQVEWMEEVRRIKKEISRERLTLEKRYKDDDPELETRLRSTDPDCMAGGVLELSSDSFLETYPIDYMPQLLGLAAMSTQESLQLDVLERLFQIDKAPDGKVKQQSGRQAGVELEEPYCTDPKARGDDDLIAHEQAAELDLAREGFLLEALAQFLFSRMASARTAQQSPEEAAAAVNSGHQLGPSQLALYYASFYWRLKGDRGEAYRCLLAYLEGVVPHSPSEAASAAKVQLGILHLKSGRYRRAVELLEAATEQIPSSKCRECYAALADAYALEGRFPEAVAAYEKAGGELGGMAEAKSVTKMALLKCTLKLFEAMEKQHTHLLETIDGVEDYKKRVARLRQLEQWIEENRAAPESRAQAKLSYEHLTFGPIPHLTCRGISLLLNKKEQHQRLHCSVDDWKAFNDSLVGRYQEFLSRAKQRKSSSAEKASASEQDFSDLDRLSAFEAQRDEFKQAAEKEMDAYLEKLKPFVGMRLNDEPRTFDEENRQAVKPVGTQLQNPFRDPKWPSNQECATLKAGRPSYSHVPLPELENSHLAVDHLTKYIAIGDGETSPLMWHTPQCEVTPSSKENMDFALKLSSVRQLRRAVTNYTALSELHLHYTISAITSTLRTPISLGDLGNRIATLLKYRIGPLWLSANLAAIFFRYFGKVPDAIACLELALEDGNSKDIAYMQLVEMLLAAVGDRASEDAEQILRRAPSHGPNLPSVQFLLGKVYQLQKRGQMAETSFLAALDSDPKHAPSINALLQLKCGRRRMVNLLPRNVKEEHRPICCWPNEQNIYCFGGGSNSETTGSKVLCFRLHVETRPPHSYYYDYFRCNTPYTGLSYAAPPYAHIIASLLKPSAELRETQLNDKIRRLIAEEARASAAQVEEEKVPVFPLDYGGYSEERIREHQRQVLPPNFENYHQFALVYGGAEEETIALHEDAEIDEEWREADGGGEPGGNVNERVKRLAEKDADGKEERVAKSDVWKGEMLESGMALPPTDKITSRAELLKYDLPLPKNGITLPKELVEKGKTVYQVLGGTRTCAPFKKFQWNKAQLLSQPATSSYVSVSVKGILLTDHIDFSTAPSAVLSSLGRPTEGIVKPICAEIRAESTGNPLLIEIDKLPAYVMRGRLQFYTAEKVLTEVFQGLGPTKESTESVANRLALALRVDSPKPGAASKLHWSVPLAASLYWRIEGDALNAIKCLRHSLSLAPEAMTDVALISLANIYHQSGFVHSALAVGGRAINATSDPVIGIHFILGNIYFSLGEFQRALDFYYSTLGLQNSFQVAKEKIDIIRCLATESGNAA